MHVIDIFDPCEQDSAREKALKAKGRIIRDWIKFLEGKLLLYSLDEHEEKAVNYEIAEAYLRLKHVTDELFNLQDLM